MKEINREIIYDLPFHDSDFLGMNISQDDNGDTKLGLSIAFCKGEYENLTDFRDAISPNGHARILFVDCAWINIISYCNVSQRDAIDYIEFKERVSKLEQYDKQGNKEYVSVVFVSGSKIECIARSIIMSQAPIDEGG